MAAPAYRSITSQGFGFNNEMTCTPPSGLANDDILLALVHKQNTDAITTPSGFTLKGTLSAVSANPFEGRLYWKRAASESGNYSFTWTNEAQCQGFVVAVSGCIATGDPFDVFANGLRDDSTASTTPNGSLTTTVVDTLLVWMSENRFGGPWTAPTGFTERFDNGASGVINFCDLVQAAIGGTGTLNTNSSAGNNPCGFHFGALKPPAGGAATSFPFERSRKARMSLAQLTS